MEDHLEKSAEPDEDGESEDSGEGIDISSFWEETDKELEDAMIAYSAIKSEEHPR